MIVFLENCSPSFTYIHTRQSEQFSKIVLLSLLSAVFVLYLFTTVYNISPAINTYYYNSPVIYSNYTNVILKSLFITGITLLSQYYWNIHLIIQLFKLIQDVLKCTVPGWSPPPLTPFPHIELKFPVNRRRGGHPIQTEF